MFYREYEIERFLKLAEASGTLGIGAGTGLQRYGRDRI